MRSVLSDLAAAVADLTLPRSCLGCGRPAAPVCSRCWRAIGQPTPFQPDPCPPGFPESWVAGPYAGVLRTAVLHVKERGRSDLLPVLAPALARTVIMAAPGPVPILLVPVPSTPAAARRRGGDHMRALARRTAVVLQDSGRVAAVLPALRLLRTPRDSAGLTSTERAVNLQGAFGAAADAASAAAGARVVLVDDVVTTGTTLSECARVLRERGVRATAAGVAGTVRRRSGTAVPVNR